MTSHLRQLCTQLGCAICSHSSVADQFEDVSLITHNGQLLGVKVQMRVPQIEHVDLEVQSTYAFAHNCACLTAVEILREGIIRPSATQYPDWLYTSGFYCRAEICQDLSLQSYAQAQTLAFKKAKKYSNFQNPFRPFMGRREVVNPSTSLLVLAELMLTMVVYNFMIVFIAKKTRGGHFDLISVKLMALLHFCNFAAFL